jgi:methyl-accepting chemotaxis protein
MNISKKMNYFSFVGISFTLLVSLYFFQNVKEDVYNNESKNILLQLIDRIEAKKNVGISNVVALSNDIRISKALKNNDKKAMKTVLDELGKKYKKDTSFKNIKVHVHTKDNKSFYRSWKDKNGDDLSWRDTIVKVNSTKQKIISFEVGKAGLTLKAVVPLFDENDVHLGSIEFIQGLNSVAKLFDADDNGFLLLMNKSELSTAKFIKNPKEVDNYILAQKYAKQDFLEDARHLDFQKLLHGEHNYYLTDRYFYTYDTVNDTTGKEIGVMLVGIKKSSIDDLIMSSAFLIIVALFVMSVLLLILRVLFHFGISKLLNNIISSLKDSSDSIELASKNLSDNSFNLSNMSANQSASVEEITATVEETSNKITQSFENMKTLETLGREVENNASLGYEQMKQLSTSMNSISKNSLEINSIVSTIDEIAFQTNLLALNAAVEAARAGEHGLGFAVVSEEVRNLANRSASESKKIHDVIENAVKEAQNGIYITKTTFESFEDIVKKVDETMEVIRENTKSSQEQKDAVEQIKNAMVQVDTVTQKLSVSSQEISASAEDLTNRVKDSNKIVISVSKMV